MNGKRHAVVVDEKGRFLGVNGRTWVNEYPNAAHLTPNEAKKLLSSAGPGTKAIAYYGEDRQEGLATNPANRTEQMVTLSQSDLIEIRDALRFASEACAEEMEEQMVSALCLVQVALGEEKRR